MEFDLSANEVVVIVAGLKQLKEELDLSEYKNEQLDAVLKRFEDVRVQIVRETAIDDNIAAMRASTVSCTCGRGDESENHYLRCAKWLSVLPNLK